MDEKEIIKGCKENNLSCQKSLYEHFYGKMMGVCLRYSSGETEAHEIIQEGFLKIYKNIRQFKEEEPFELWMKKNMIEVAVKYIRSDKEQRLIVSTVHETKAGAKTKVAAISDDEIIANIQQKEVLKAVQELSLGYRIVFNLMLIDGYSLQETSEVLSISELTSKANFEKSRFAFRKNLIQSFK